MKSETTDKPGRVACYMRVGTKEQLSPKQRAAMFPDESKDNSIPVECVCVGVANDLAMEIEHMMQTDGELLKYFAVMEVEEPQTMAAALDLAMDLDNYERVPENTDEYGMSALQRYRGDEELFELIEGYMDFDRFAKDMMHEDGVRRTAYGPHSSMR